MNLILSQNEKSWALFRLFNQFQLSIEFHTETFDLQYKSNDSFLYEMQHWGEMSWKQTLTNQILGDVRSRAPPDLHYLFVSVISY